MLISEKCFDGCVSYWMHVFPISKKIIKQIETICRNFLWSGKATGRKAYIAWKKIYEPKNSGDLYITSLIDSNNATILKLL